MFELLFKYPPAVFRNGDVVLLSGWPVGLLGVAIAAAALVWGAQLLRPSSARLGLGRAVLLWLLQTLFAALVLLLLWRPAIQIAASRPQQNLVAVMVDGSRSMALDDPGRGVRSKVVAESVTARLLPALQSRFQVRLYGFSDRATPIDRLDALAVDGRTTRVAESLSEVLRASRVLPVAAVVLFSDGADNSAGSRAALEEITRAGIPVHTVGVGRAVVPGDLELEDAIVPARVPAGARVKVALRLRHHGLGGRTVHVSVREGERVLASRDVVIAREPGQERGSQSEELFVPAGAAGAKTLVVAVDPVGDEIKTNNRLARPLQVVSRKARVLYVEGEPRWELKFIRRAVEDDATLQLMTLLRTSGNKVYRQGIDDATTLAEGFPTRAEDLFAFDALMIGSVEAAYFSREQQQLVKDFAGRRGGSVLFLGGRHSFGDGGWSGSPVADVLPVRLSAPSPTFARRPARAELTPAGRTSLLCLLEEDAAKNAARWAALPELADFQSTGELKPGAVALLNAAGHGAAPAPLLAVQSYGRGQTLAFTTGGSWRWRMELPHEDTTHATFWRQLLRGLVARDAGPVAVSTDRALYADDERVTVRAEVRTRAYEPVSDARVWATLVGEDGRRETFELGPAPGARGLYETRLSAARPGRHRIEVHASRGDTDLGRESALIYREDGVAEGFHPEQNAELLRGIAQATGGRYWSIDDLGDIAGEITYSGTGITVRETLDLWDMPAVFVLALALRGAEWLVRRRGGRV